MFNFSKLKKTFVIAEAGVNHEGSFKEAIKLIDVAKKSGADAVKFQTYLTEKYVASSEKQRFERVKRFELKFAEFKKLYNYCKKKKIIFLSTPLDNESTDFLVNLVPFFKISSGDITNIKLLKYIASKNKPILLSTGGAEIDEIKKAINIINKNSKLDSKKYLGLMHCVPLYPVPANNANLKNIIELKSIFKNTIGYSDHTIGLEAAIIATSYGAKIIEKHFTITRKNKVFHDHFVSLDKDELPKLISAIKNTQLMLGSEKRIVNKAIKLKLPHIRRSFAVNKDLIKGSNLKMEDLILLRPSQGFKESESFKLINKKLRTNLKKGQLINKKDII